MTRRLPAWLDWRIPAILGGAVIVVVAAVLLAVTQTRNVTHIERITRVVHPPAQAAPVKGTPTRPVVVVVASPPVSGRPSHATTRPTSRPPSQPPKPSPTPTSICPLPGVCLPPAVATLRRPK